MARRLPPLKALRSFEAAARALSFTRAAEDLSVTQTAISHQVRTLEEWLGTRVFRRGGRRLELTEAGTALFSASAEAFDRIAEATERIRGRPDRLTLSVSVTPTFGARWLATRLARFWRAHPDVDLRIHHSVQLVDFTREPVDCGVRWGRGSWPGVDAERLLPAPAVPLCSPALAAGPPPIREPSDLRHHVLLHDRAFQEWKEWLAAAGAEDVDASRGPLIDDVHAVVRAAVEGHGVMLGPSAMLSDEIDSGRLVAPFGVEPDSELAYYFVCPPGALARPLVRTFHDFVFEEASAHQRAIDATAE